jgi:GT2 family glycosyltransferase
MLLESINSLQKAEHDFEVTLSLANSGNSINGLPKSRMRMIVKTVPNSYFWADAMHEASRFFYQEQNFDFVLWLNEDVTLTPNSLCNLVEVLKSNTADIVIGQSYSQSGDLTYGGFNQESPLKPLHFKRARAISDPVPVDTFNGNIVLIGKKALNRIGPFLKGYRHYLADIAYGLEASRKGLKIVVAPGASGICEENLKVNRSLDTSIKRSKRLSDLNSPDGIPFIPQWKFSIRYGGVLGVFYFLATYTRFFATLMFYRRQFSK